jgi:CheY-like chemotaxis protein
VLVVDDNPVNRELARTVLEHMGAEVAEASGGRAAIEAAAVEPFDCILMDLRMPGVSGTDALCEIRDTAGPQPGCSHPGLHGGRGSWAPGQRPWLRRPGVQADHGGGPGRGRGSVHALGRRRRRSTIPSISRRPEVGRTRILVVEDDPIILDLITTRLDIAGYDTYFARDGFEGLKRLHELRPSALVLDLNMPRLDGFGLLRKMRLEG